MANSEDWRKKGIKETLLFPHTKQMLLYCKVIKKWQPPHFYINLPFSGLSPLCSKKFRTPQVTQFLEGSSPSPFLLLKGGGGGTPILFIVAPMRKEKYFCVILQKWHWRGWLENIAHIRGFHQWQQIIPGIFFLYFYQNLVLAC